jgi:hypothetical protein
MTEIDVVHILGSSNIASICYNPDNKKMLIRFLTGTLYEYDKISPDTWRAFKKAESKGKFANAFIYPKYTGRLISEEDQMKAILRKSGKE